MKDFLWREARAKINLSLSVLGRRSDGYHDLDSLMARLDLADRVGLRLSGRGREDRLEIESRLPETLPPDFDGPGNLALRAAAAYRAVQNWPAEGVVIALEKNIPCGAGLGGGSADGAAVLELLNRSAPRPLAPAALAALGLSLGADLPFCLWDRPLALAGGVGDKLAPPTPEQALWIGRKLWLVKPAFALSTAEVFKKLGLTKGTANNNLGPMSPAPAGRNDLLKPALELAPALAEVAGVLAGLKPEAWGLSGSGPTFWLYDPAREADFPADKFPGCWLKAAKIR